MHVLNARHGLFLQDLCLSLPIDTHCVSYSAAAFHGTDTIARGWKWVLMLGEVHTAELFRALLVSEVHIGYLPSEKQNVQQLPDNRRAVYSHYYRLNMRDKAQMNLLRYVVSYPKIDRKRPGPVPLSACNISGVGLP